MKKKLYWLNCLNINDNYYVYTYKNYIKLKNDDDEEEEVCGLSLFSELGMQIDYHSTNKLFHLSTFPPPLTK